MVVGKISTNIRIRKGVQWNGMENTAASKPVISVTIIADTAAPENVYRNMVIAPIVVRIRLLKIR